MTDNDIKELAKKIANSWAEEKLENPNSKFLKRLPQSEKEENNDDE